jgi:hypothetical protein
MAVMLALLMKGINDLMWHDIHTKFHEDWYRRSSNIKGLPLKFERL